MTCSASGPLQSYRLSIRKASPHFELIADPLLAPPASNRPVPKVSDLAGRGKLSYPGCRRRKDGFEGEVKLEFKDCPPGLIISQEHFEERIPWSFFCGRGLFRKQTMAENIRLPRTAKVDDHLVVRSCKMAKICWTDYDNQSKLALSKFE